jgi:hypothetical protein
MPAPSLTHPQLCGRITAVRRALDALQAQAELDGQGTIPGYGSLKVSLINYENELRNSDRAVERGEPLPQAVALVLAGRSA